MMGDRLGLDQVAAFDLQHRRQAGVEIAPVDGLGRRSQLVQGAGLGVGSPSSQKKAMSCDLPRNRGSILGRGFSAKSSGGTPREAATNNPLRF